jgi:DNA-binding response OmpR family regulator
MTMQVTTEIAELLQQAMDQGRLVVMRATPPPRADAKLIIALHQLFALNAGEARALVVLLRQKQASRAVLHDAACAGLAGPKSHLLYVIISKLRAKLRPHGVEIGTAIGSGYAIGARSRAKVRKIIEEHDPSLVGELKPDK